MLITGANMYLKKYVFEAKQFTTVIENELEYKNASNKVMNSSESNARAIVVVVGLTTVNLC